MTEFSFTSPEGREYSITGPDGATPQQAFAMLQQHLGSAPPVDDKPGAGLRGVQSFLGGALDLPIVGPALHAAPSYLNAGIDTLTGGTPFAENLKNYQGAQTAVEQAHPIAAGAGRVAGTVGASIPLAMTGPGAVMLGLGAKTLPGMMGAGAASGAGIGAADALVRGNNPITEGGMGGAIGAALPPVLRGAGMVASPLLSNISARLNSQGYAQSQVARMLMESGKSAADVDAALAAAKAQGQGDVYTVADAIGNPGARGLSTVARAPGEGRQAVVDAMEARQADQSQRVANQLAEGFGARRTSAQLEKAMTDARGAQGDMEYGAARKSAGPVDLSDAISKIDETLAPGLSQIARPQSGLAADTIESALQGVRSRLTDGRSVLTDFTAAQRVRGDLADQVEAAKRAGLGNKARLLGGVLRQVDSAMEDASPGFLQANRNFSQWSKNIDAIEEGGTAAGRGRTQDIIPQFQALTPEGQLGFRTGYVDPKIASAQRATVGTNAAGPFTGKSFKDISAAIAPNNAKMQAQLARENEMFKNAYTALGGSKTADNLADQAGMGVDPGIILHAFAGNHMGVMRGLYGMAQNGLTGNTAAVRAQVGRLLLANGNMPPKAMQRLLDQTMQRIQQNQRAMQLASRSGALAFNDQANR